jgi:type I restriction enzyme S subunit
MSYKTYFLPVNQYCIQVTDGTHDSPKPVSAGKYLITSKHLSRYKLDFNSAYKISLDDYNKIIERSNVEQYDILYSMIGTIGNIYQEMSPNIDYAVKNVAIFKCNDYYKSKWLYYYLQTPIAKEYIYSNIKGSTQRYISLQELRKMPIMCLNDNSVRNKIVDILVSQDSKIAINLTKIEYLESIVQGVYDNLFTDFNYSNNATNIENSIPVDWIYSNVFNNITEVREKNTSNFDYPVLSVVKEGEFKLSDNVFTKQVYSKKTTNYKIVRRNQVAYNPARANIGSIAMLTDFDVGLVSPIYVVFKMKETITPTFFYYYMKQPMFLKNIKHHAIGTTRQNFPFEAFKMFNMVVPPMELQLRFEEIAKPIEQKIAKLKEENAVLAEIRDTLLPKLISGELPVEVGEA